MGAAAIPIVMAVVGAAGSVAQAKSASNRAKKAYENSKKNQYAFSDDQREMMKQQLLSFLVQGNQLGAPQQQQPIPGDQWLQQVMARYSTPTPAYQGFLQAQQERRDARSGVPLPPPQGAASPSAQRGMPTSYGARTY